MAKHKNKKVSSDHVNSKKELLKKKKVMNPFEIHVNKEKLRVIGKHQKNDRGLPGVSRAKAIQKRKHTLLREYKDINRSNKFLDKRIGEKNHAVMTDEEKDIARYAAVRVKAHTKQNIYNIAGDQFTLTRGGQTLSEIEKFEDIRSDEEFEEEDNSGRLDKQFVANAHFGGGIVRNTGNEGVKTHKELIEQLIIESKKRKAEKQKIKEATMELTEKLDTEWKDLMPLLAVGTQAEKEKTDKPKLEDYDKYVRELRFEARGAVSDRLKTEDEVAKEEKEKLEKLEQDRLERMKGQTEKSVSQPTHRSADDLDDDFVYEPDSDYMLSYNNEGEANVQVDAELNGKTISQNSNAESRHSDDEDSDDKELSEEEEDELEAESDDNLSDLKEDASDSETEETSLKQNEQSVKEKQEKVTAVHQPEHEVTESAKTIEDIKDDLLKRKEIMEQAREELPYTFSLPASYEDLKKEFENQSSFHQSVIIERMVKCNHPSLAQGNKENLSLLLAYLLQYLNDLFEDVSDAETIKSSFEVFRTLVPQFYELAQVNPESAHKSLLEVIKEKHADYKKKRKDYPGYEVLAFLKLVSILFTTSDFRHQIVTPCFIFMEQMLTKCKIKSKRDISYGLYVSTLILEYTVLSKRYLPAVINFLGGILHMAVPKTTVKLIKVLPPFKATASNLVLIGDHSLNSLQFLQLDSKDLINSEIDEDYKIRVLYTTLKLLEEFYGNLSELSSSIEIFEPILKYLELIPKINYPCEVRTLIEDFTHTLRNAKNNKKLVYVAMEAKKPKALRLYEPKIEEVYDGKRFKKQSKEKAEKDKLLHKLKKETKGALREIRRDKAFLGRVKINERIQSDKERKEKVKRLYSEAALQQSELNALDRKKKKK